jgi:hypothetical protein
MLTVKNVRTFPSDTLHSANPTCTSLGLNPRFCGERPTTSRLSHGTALLCVEQPNGASGMNE